jgi:hypothetical protein
MSIPTPQQDAIVSMDQMSIVEKYEDFLNYTYPIFIGISRGHLILRDQVISAALIQVDLFIQAGKSNQISKLYIADANLAMLRFYLRFMADSRRKLISKHQHQVGCILLAEVGKMLGAWIKTIRAKG